MPTEPFTEEPSGTRESIMFATYRALRAHGYADLTIQRIGDEFEKSKSLLYHHYDGKDELLVDFLEFLLDRFERDVSLDESASATTRLWTLVDHLHPVPLDAPRRDIMTAIVELRAQAPHDAAVREQFTQSDRYFQGRFATVVREGIETGEFREVDPDAVASYLYSTLHGSLLRRLTADGVGVGQAVESELEAYVEERLLKCQ